VRDSSRSEGECRICRDSSPSEGAAQDLVVLTFCIYALIVQIVCWLALFGKRRTTRRADSTFFFDVALYLLKRSWVGFYSENDAKNVLLTGIRTLFGAYFLY